VCFSAKMSNPLNFIASSFSLFFRLQLSLVVAFHMLRREQTGSRGGSSDLFFGYILLKSCPVLRLS
jgi:hypothetical protein